MTVLESETGSFSDSASDNERYDDDNLMGLRIMDFSQSGTADGNKGDNSLMVQNQLKVQFLTEESPIHIRSKQLVQGYRLVVWCSLIFGTSVMQGRDLNQHSPFGSSTSKHLSCSHQL